MEVELTAGDPVPALLLVEQAHEQIVGASVDDLPSRLTLLRLGALSRTTLRVDSSGQRFATLAPIEEEPSPRRIHLVQNWFQELEELVPTEN